MSYVERDRSFRRSMADKDSARRGNKPSTVSRHRDGTLRRRMTLAELKELDAELDAQIAAIIAGNNTNPQEA